MSILTMRSEEIAKKFNSAKKSIFNAKTIQLLLCCQKKKYFKTFSCSLYAIVKINAAIGIKNELQHFCSFSRYRKPESQLYKPNHFN